MGVVRTAAVGLGHVGPGRESGNQRQAPVPLIVSPLFGGPHQVAADPPAFLARGDGQFADVPVHVAGEVRAAADGHEAHEGVVADRHQYRPLAGLGEVE